MIQVLCIVVVGIILKISIHVILQYNKAKPFIIYHTHISQFIHHTAEQFHNLCTLSDFFLFHKLSILHLLLIDDTVTVPYHFIITRKSFVEGSNLFIFCFFLFSFFVLSCAFFLTALYNISPPITLSFIRVNCRFCGALHSVNWADISVLSQVIRNVNERKTVQTNMISFVSHGAGILTIMEASAEHDCCSEAQRNARRTEHHISSVPFFLS